MNIVFLIWIMFYLLNMDLIVKDERFEILYIGDENIIDSVYNKLKSIFFVG